MKRILPLIIHFGLVITANAQPFTKAPAVGVHLAFFDFAGADSLRSFGRQMKTGLAIHYQNSLSKRFDYSITLAGSFLDFMNRINKSLGNGEKQLLVEADYSIRTNLVKPTALFKPYLQAGAGVSMYNNYYGLFIPAGVGCQVNVTKDVFILVNSQFRIPVTTTQHWHFYHSIGLAGTINRKKISKEKTAPSLPIVIRKPIDSDGDGIADSIDKCPVVPGVIRYHGCPVPDRDGDLIKDDEDECPDVKGVIQYKGCPVPDKDQDGVEDAQDKCPDDAGSPVNGGCPEIKDALKAKINVAAKHIFFETGSFTLLSKSYPFLEEVIRVLKENPELKLLIEGHTDNKGTPGKNQVLSENRARSVLNYLVKSGISISRLQAAGYGQQQPIADNGSSEGRATNRRVEFKLQAH